MKTKKLDAGKMFLVSLGSWLIFRWIVFHSTFVFALIGVVLIIGAFIKK